MFSRYFGFAAEVASNNLFPVSAYPQFPYLPALTSMNSLSILTSFRVLNLVNGKGNWKKSLIHNRVRKLFGRWAQFSLLLLFSFNLLGFLVHMLVIRLASVNDHAIGKQRLQQVQQFRDLSGLVNRTLKNLQQTYLHFLILKLLVVLDANWRQGFLQSKVIFMCGLQISTLKNTSIELKTQENSHEKARKYTWVPHVLQPLMVFTLVHEFAFQHTSKTASRTTWNLHVILPFVYR